ALSGHLQPDSGWIGGLNNGVHMLFQEAYASLTPHRSILDLVREIAAPGFSILGEAMRLGLSPDRLLHTAGELSSGQRRRAALLRALSVEPKVLILDEPTASLDRDTASAVMRLVLDVQQQRQLACLLITHDRSLAEAVADEVVEMSEGTLC
ncbi:MAG: ATP-binding cassette domain-containing protein, partial [Planctomycetota bacterium]